MISGRNIHHPMLAFHKENTALRKKIQILLPKFMLASLAILCSFVTDVYMEDISDTKFQLHRIHLENVLYNKTRKIIASTYVSILVSLLKFVYAVSESTSQSILLFLTFFRFWKRNSFFLFYPFFESTGTGCSFFFPSLSIQFTSKRLSMPFIEFL